MHNPVFLVVGIIAIFMPIPVYLFSDASLTELAKLFLSMSFIVIGLLYLKMASE
jgi:hypothetical protein